MYNHVHILHLIYLLVLNPTEFFGFIECITTTFLHTHHSLLAEPYRKSWHSDNITHSTFPKQAVVGI